MDIAPTDAGFTSRGCGTWSPDLTPKVTPGQPFGDGTYLVGAEIAPGRYYASSPTTSCYWTRLGSFDGDMNFGYDLSDDILGYGRLAIVDILQTDVGFRSSGCGNWSGANPLRFPSRSARSGTAPTSSGRTSLRAATLPTRRPDSASGTGSMPSTATTAGVTPGSAAGVRGIFRVGSRS